jgi:hypothetical protein
MNYPKPGQALVPALLHWAIASPVPPHLIEPPLASKMRLCDVDGATLEAVNPAVRAMLHEHVISVARASVTRWPTGLLSMEIEVPAGLGLRDLDLSNRTHNCLGRAGLDDGFHRLADCTLGDMLDIPGFGAGCLLELLWALEWAIAAGSPVLADSLQAPWERLDCLLQEHCLSQIDASDGLLDVECDAATVSAGRYLRDVAALVRDELGFRTDIAAAAHLLRSRIDAQEISPRDPRLGSLVSRLRSLNSTEATLGERLEHSVAFADMDSRSFRSLLDTLRRLQSTLDEMATLTLEQELEVLLLPPPGRNRSIVQQRVGWTGSGPATLDDIGREFGVTRERVRQICAKATSRLDGQTPYAPRLDAALRIISETVPALSQDVDVALQQHGVSRGTIRFDGLLAASRLLGRPDPGFAVDDLLVVGKAQGARKEPGSAKILSEARKAVAHWGMTTFADVAALACEGWDETRSLRAVVAILETRQDFCLLDEDGGWFCLMETARNSLTTRMAKILSVASPIHVSDLRVGLGRPYRARGFAPPQRVLLRLCTHLPGYAIEGSFVRAEPPLDRNHVLVGAEARMADVLSRNGGVMRRADFEKACVRAGANRSTFSVYLDYSPIICRYAPGVYGLRGAPIQPGVVEQLAPKRTHTRVLVDHGWTKDGHVWIGYRLSPSLISSGVFTVPAGLRGILDGQYPLSTSDDVQVATLVVQSENCSAWGLSPFFRRRGGEPGDYLLLRFDLKTSSAEASLGDETLLENPSGATRHAAVQLGVGQSEVSLPDAVDDGD